MSHSLLPTTEKLEFKHISVLAQELISGLKIVPGGHYLDATVGGGGHSKLILDAANDIKITAIDRDQQALTAAQTKLANYQEQVQFWQGNFAEYPNPENIKFDGIIADLGVSSAQLDIPERGFSFQHTAPLDMRMDRSQDLSAVEIINHWQQNELINIFFEYGEERFSKRLSLIHI